MKGQTCDFDWREMEALMFLSCIVVIKTRSALSWYQTYSTALQFAKITSAYLFFRMNVYIGIFYWLVFNIFSKKTSIYFPTINLSICLKCLWLHSRSLVTFIKTFVNFINVTNDEYLFLWYQIRQHKVY